MARRSRAKATVQASKLPNAPLAEAVFELRWKLFGDEGTPPPLLRDPGYFGCVDSLIERAKSIGFREHKITARGPVSAHSVERRFHRSEGESFPVLQIGPGIFAVNESSGYAWDSFRELCLSAVELLVSCYPKMSTFPFVPFQVQLRYIDAFKNDPSPTDGLIGFLNQSTNIEIKLPDFLRGSQFGPIGDTQLHIAFPVKSVKDTRFVVTLSKGTVSGVERFVMQSSVTTTVQPAFLGKDSQSARKAIDEWIDEAHEIASPFFKAFAKESLMRQFRENPSA